MTRGIMVGHIDEPTVDTDAARRDIIAAIERGDLTQADVDSHCRRIFYYIYKLCTPRSPNPRVESVLPVPHRQPLDKWNIIAIFVPFPLCCRESLTQPVH